MSISRITNVDTGNFNSVFCAYEHSGIWSESGEQDVFNYYRALLGGAYGSIVHLGIGPIVTASIVLQL